MINLIACVTIFKNKLAIGKNGDLLFKLKDDQRFFKTITMSSLTTDSKLSRNIVLMGRKTWFSIPQKNRPLQNRINLILTNDSKLLTTKVPKNFEKVGSDGKGVHYFITMKTFWKIYEKYCPNVFVIGGSQLYNEFMDKADNLYITHVQTAKFEKGSEPDTFMEPPNSNFKLIGYSERYTQELNYRILIYKRTNLILDEQKYLDLAKCVLQNGKERIDRTGVGTLSIFGAQLRFDISNDNLPLLTTKQIPLKSIVEELLFFCRGETDTKILESKGVNIWRGNTTREFLDSRGLYNYPDGVMGPMYGRSWRAFGKEYDPINPNSTTNGFDQLAHVEHLLKTDPFSRRIYISNLNPAESSKMCLEPCHTYIQFYVEEKDGEKYLSGYFTMRSNDLFLGNPWNYISYGLLVQILALKCNMKPKEIVYNGVDCHIYKNHILQVKEQLSRTPRPCPHIRLARSLKDKDWADICFSDFELIGYFPHQQIKAPMAI